MPTTLSPTDHYVQINGLSLHYVDWGVETPTATFSWCTDKAGPPVAGIS